MKPIHIKVYCKNCGELLSHERVEIEDPPDPKNPLRQYVAVEVDPWCEGCLGKRP